MPTKTTKPKTQRQRVRCTKCDWKGQRAAGEDPGNCPRPRCGAPCEGPGEIGRPALDESEKLIRVVAFVTPATFEWLGEEAGPTAAKVLDRAATRSKLAHADV